jgi:O-antigen/teichoic acid export membrane protein
MTRMRQTALAARGAIRNDVRSVLPLLLGNIMLGVLGLATAICASQLLGSDGRGELAARQNIATLLAVFGSIGLGEATVYFSARAPSATRQITRRCLLLSSVGIVGAIAVAVVLILVLIDDADTRVGALWYLLIIPVTVVFTIAYQPLRSLGRMTAWISFRLGITTGWLACLLLGLLLDRPSPQLMAMSFCGVMTIAAALALWQARSYPADAPEARPPDRELLRYGIPAAFVAIPQSINLRLDQVLLVGLVSRDELGIYVAAVGWSWIALPVFTAFAQFVLPKVAGMDAAGRDRWRTRTPKIVGLLGVVTFLGLVIPTRVLFARVMGQEFEDGVNVATLMLMAGTLNGVLLVLEELAKGLGHPRWVLVAEIVGMSVTVCMLAVLLAPFGIVGAAWASILGYATVSLVLLVQLRRHRPGSELRS